MNSAAGAAGAGGLFAPLGHDRVSPGMVIDVAGLILQGFHAVPVKLKMLLDRLFSLLSPLSLLSPNSSPAPIAFLDPIASSAPIAPLDPI